MLIYHIIPRAVWLAAQQQSRYAPQSLQTEGFIHCSTWGQVKRVADASYREVPELLLLCIDAGRLQAELRWEAPVHPETGPAPTTQNAERFPHLYGSLNFDAITDVLSLDKHADGQHIMPEKPSDDG
jgi:uncharacterized protein (DUF952 family)